MDHLFRVAGGLDSLMIGEAQVLGQLKRALSLARQAGALDAQLEIIIRGALPAAKRIRHETGLGRRPVSVSHAAVAATQEVLGGLAGRNVLLLGADEMSEVTLRLLCKQRSCSAHRAWRRYERADEVAQAAGAAAVPFDGIEEIIGAVDIIVSSSSAPHHLLDAGRVITFQERRGGRPLLIVDMAVPRDVDPSAAGVAGVHLLNIDDLQRVDETNREAREAFVPAAEQISAEEVRATGHALDARESAPTVQALVSRMERLRDGVLERHLARVPATEVATREAMRDLADALTAKFLHGPIRALRESADPTLEAAGINDDFEVQRTPSEA